MSKENGSNIILVLPKVMYPSLKTRVEDIKALGYDNIYIDAPEEDQDNPYIVDIMPKRKIVVRIVSQKKNPFNVDDEGLIMGNMLGLGTPMQHEQISDVEKQHGPHLATIGEICSDENLKQKVIMGNMLAKAIRGYC